MFFFRLEAQISQFNTRKAEESQSLKVPQMRNETHTPDVPKPKLYPVGTSESLSAYSYLSPSTPFNSDNTSGRINELQQKVHDLRTVIDTMRDSFEEQVIAHNA